MSEELQEAPPTTAHVESPFGPTEEVDEPTVLGASSKPGRSNVMREISSRYGLIVVWLLMAAVYGILIPHVFLSVGTLQTIFGSQSTLVFLCMAAVAVFVVGEFDLSIASIMGLSATTTGVLAVNLGWPEPVSVLVALAVGVLCGVVNGFVIVRLEE